MHSSGLSFVHTQNMRNYGNALPTAQYHITTTPNINPIEVIPPSYCVSFEVVYRVSNTYTMNQNYGYGSIG